MWHSPLLKAIGLFMMTTGRILPQGVGESKDHY